MRHSNCPLCNEPGGLALAADARLRVVLVEDPLHPAFARVIWNEHVAEMSELSESDRDHLMSVVFECEAVMRQTLAPDKINLASLGNVVPHLHWHVIGRWKDDAHFPASVWSAPAERDPQVGRTRAAITAAAVGSLKEALRARLVRLGLAQIG